MTNEERRQRRKALVEAVRQGADVAALARQVGLKLSTIQHYCWREGLPPRTGPQITPEQRRQRREAVVEAVRNGAEVRSLAQRVGLSPSTIYTYCWQAGVRLRGSTLGQPRSEARSYAIIADLIHGRGRMSAIAERHGLTRQRIEQIRDTCLAAGIPIDARYHPRHTWRRK